MSAGSLSTRQTRDSIIQPEGLSSRSTSYNSEEDFSPNGYPQTEEDEWEDDDEDVHPSDSASASNSRPSLRTRPHRVKDRRHRAARQPAPYRTVQEPAPIPPPSVDSSEEYPFHGRGFQPPPSHAPPFYGPRGPGPGYHVGQYMGPYPQGNQMVPYGNYPQNPFSPMSNGSSGGGYFPGGDPRGMYDMQYQHGYYNPGPHRLPPHMQAFQLGAPPPPPTEHPGTSTTPGARDSRPVIDPDKARLEAEIERLQLQDQKLKQEEIQRQIEARIRKDAEDAFNLKMEEIRRENELRTQEFERAKLEAERAARERIEAERREEKERARQREEDLKRAEENARAKIEAAIKADEERREKEKEDLKRAEEAAKIRVEAAYKAQAEAKAAEEKRIAEEVERIKRIEEDAKRKAEAEALAKVEADKKKAQEAAEAEEAAKKEAEALKQRIQEETKAKLEEAARKKGDKAPIRFKDAVGRKFSFPFHLCSTWPGMEELIKQAFLNLDVLGRQVQDGHYDLTGPNGEIILPSVWEKVIEPDWQVTMTMWPEDRIRASLAGARMGGHPMGGRHGPFAMGAGSRMPPHIPGAPPPRRGGIPPPPRWGEVPTRGSRIPEGVDIMDAHPRTKPSKSKRNSTTSWGGLFAGGKKPTKKKSSKKG